MKKPLPVVLVVAGVDPSGGAGIFADFRAVESAGARAVGAVTALTVQTETSFFDYIATSVNTLEATVRAMTDAYDVKSIKTGMLPTREIVESVSGLLNEIRFQHVVIDPVIFASVGARLVNEEAQSAIGELLIPQATLLTPNISEASALSGIEVNNIADMKKAGKILHGRGARAVVVTGGHLDGEAIDVLVDSEGTREIRADRERGSIHGTGCSFASVTAAALARGLDTAGAVAAAKAYVKSLFRNQLWRTDK